MKHILFKVFIIGLFCSNVQATDRSYKIEVLIFAQDSASTEVFEQTESNIDWPNKIVKRSEFQNVESSALGLKDSYSKLAKGDDYQPLMYEAWIQKVKANSYSRAVKIANAEGTINGFFRLQRGHLIHMIADIEYSPETYEDLAIYYRLNEKRRFKLNETHYLDHPKFGILVKVSPIDS